jgi:ABC-2 type transport system permease protein
MMFVNNIFFLIYWLFFFSIFKSASFQLGDIFYIYSIVYTGFGLSQFLCGNLPNISDIVTSGKLDYYLLKPQNPLLHLIMAKSSTIALGDILYGVMAFVLVMMKDFSLIKILLWILLSIVVAVIISSYYIILGSFSFILGNSKSISDIGGSALIMFATYPQIQTSFWIRITLSTFIPSIIISLYPLNVLKFLNLTEGLYLLIFTIVIASLSYAFFKYGLTKYESSNTFNQNI